jgi:hypothetical protein
MCPYGTLRCAFTAWYEPKSLGTIQVNLTHADCAMVQAVSRLPITAEGAVLSQDRSCQSCGEQRDNGPRFPRLLPFPPVSIIPPMLHTHHLRVAVARTNARSLGTFQKSDCVSEIAECRIHSTFIQPHFPYPLNRGSQSVL